MSSRLLPHLLAEAVASSLIEGEKVSAAAVTKYASGEEVPDYPRDDLRRCLNLYRAMRDLRGKVGTRLALDYHRRLFEGVEIPEGSSLVPGKMRTVPVGIDRGWIYIPRMRGGKVESMEKVRDILPMMDPAEVPEAMRMWGRQLLERGAAERGTVSPYHAGMSHQIFERIHPFVDGNGRVGRALMWAQLGYGLSEEIFAERATYYRSLNSAKKCGEFMERLVAERALRRGRPRPERHVTLHA